MTFLLALNDNRPIKRNRPVLIRPMPDDCTEIYTPRILHNCQRVILALTLASLQLRSRMAAEESHVHFEVDEGDGEGDGAKDHGVRVVPRGDREAVVHVGLLQVHFL